MAGLTPKGKLPDRVYWYRRVVVALIAIGCLMLLILLVSNLFGSSGATATKPQPSNKPTDTIKKVPEQVAKGDCAAAKVFATAKLTSAIGGSSVAIPVALTAPTACSFKLSAETFAARVNSGKDRLWSSQDCPAAVPNQELVLSPKPTRIILTWHARRSSAGCPDGTSWALPGYYHIQVAAMGGAPTDTQFRLTAPDRPVVTKTRKPKVTQTPATDAGKKPGKKAN